MLRWNDLVLASRSQAPCRSRNWKCSDYLQWLLLEMWSISYVSQNQRLSVQPQLSWYSPWRYCLKQGQISKKWQNEHLWEETYSLSLLYYLKWNKLSFLACISFFINSYGHSEFPLIAFQKYLNDEQQESSVLVTSYYYLSYRSA